MTTEGAYATSGRGVHREYAIMNGLLAVSGPTSDGEGIRALWSRLSSRNGLTLVCRTVTVGDWTPDPWTYGNTAQKDD